MLQVKIRFISRQMFQKMLVQVNIVLTQISAKAVALRFVKCRIRRLEQAKGKALAGQLRFHCGQQPVAKAAALVRRRRGYALNIRHS